MAAADDRVIVTEDISDFIAGSRWSADGRQHSGIILTRPATFDRSRSSCPGSLVRALKTLLATVPPSGDSWLWWL